MMRWLLLGLFLPLAASAQGLYKWVDEKGVVHYSDKPPAGQSGRKLDVAPQPPLDGSSSPQRSRSWQEQLAESNERRHQAEKAEQQRQKAAKEAEQKCLKARSALASLKRERPIYRSTKEGERVYIEDTERQRLAEGWQQQADTYCR